MDGNSMKRMLFLVVLFGLIVPAHAQLDTESIPPAEDQNDLFARAAASRLAIVGTVIKSEGKSERISDEAILDRLRKGKGKRLSRKSLHHQGRGYCLPTIGF